MDDSANGNSVPKPLIIDNVPQSKHTPRILSLDGGGVRGLSTLLILRNLMEEIGRRNSTSTAAKPCDYFDMIGGTSTGGLIAIMLGLLGMVSSLFPAKLSGRKYKSALRHILTCRKKYLPSTKSSAEKYQLAIINVVSITRSSSKL